MCHNRVKMLSDHDVNFGVSIGKNGTLYPKCDPIDIFVDPTSAIVMGDDADADAIVASQEDDAAAGGAASTGDQVVTMKVTGILLKLDTIAWQTAPLSISYLDITMVETSMPKQSIQERLIIDAGSNTFRMFTDLITSLAKLYTKLTNKNLTYTLLGTSGQGKSVFASIATGKKARISNNDNHATLEAQAYDISGLDVILDTPGLNMKDVPVEEYTSTYVDIVIAVNEIGVISNQRLHDKSAKVLCAAMTKLATRDAAQQEEAKKILGMHKDTHITFLPGIIQAHIDATHDALKDTLIKMLKDPIYREQMFTKLSQRSIRSKRDASGTSTSLIITKVDQLLGMAHLFTDHAKSRFLRYSSDKASKDLQKDQQNIGEAIGLSLPSAIAIIEKYFSLTFGVPAHALYLSTKTTIPDSEEIR